MSSNAIEYANSLAQSIRENTEAGYPFGVVNADTEEWYSDLEDAHAQVDPGEARDNLEPANAGDYLDVLDIKYIVNSDRTYNSALICIALGGPTAWINTRTECLEVGWWSATEYRELPSEFIRGLDEYLEDIFDC